MKKHPICFLLIFLLISFHELQAGKMEKAFEALKVYNYFKAKEIFEKSIRKQPVPAAFGLSIIYSRFDNPFTNIDSANKYILLCNRFYESANPSKKSRYLAYQITEQAIDSLNERISGKAFKLYRDKNSIAGWERFINAYQLPFYCFKAIDLRDSLLFDIAKQKNTYTAYDEFLRDHPLSIYAGEAKQRYELTLFQSSTAGNTIKEFENFLIRYPNSPFKDDAENSIYKLSVAHGSIADYYRFIKKYPKNNQVETAWRTIYSMYTVNYSPSVIENFMKAFPDYPFKETINQDLILSAKKLYAIRENEKWGFIDSNGNDEILCNYEWVDKFSEGLAECGLHDKSGFIDKTGKIIIPFIYNEVEPFQNGLSIVKL
ncbi:MAG TPA: WG repeat-containing protein, partial [Chitinophagales bacterium]|nr:WG repeat-containing protein [Chitinophagales bacterium]